MEIEQEQIQSKKAQELRDLFFEKYKLEWERDQINKELAKINHYIDEKRNRHRNEFSNEIMNNPILRKYLDKYTGGEQ